MVARTRTEGPYTAAWRRYRRWSWAFWIVFLLFLPAFSVLSRALGLGRGDGTALFMAALVWMVAFAVIGYQRGNFRCPRCGELFFQKFDDRSWRMSWQHNPFARRCLHCGLPKWAQSDPR